ncbi:uncharacterized protein V6R79_026337 [Siganus canaliculatus]
MTIKNFSIEYDANNSQNTFTNGDTISGRIIVEVSSETKIQSLTFIAKGEANVRWTEHHGHHHHHHAHSHHPKHHVYWQKEKYYDVKQHILREARQDGTEVIGKGRHVFPFTFRIPDTNLPSSFKSSIGKIVHKVKAELKQSMKLTKKANAHFTFVSKADMGIPGLMEPQHGTKDKSLAFGSGIVGMDVHIKRMGYRQGEPLEVKLEISNQSSRSVTPKFILYEKKSHFAQGKRRLETKDLLKDKSKEIASGTKETVTKVINIPKELPSSILNCPIIKLEYRMKVELDIKCAVDPHVKLHVVVLPASDTTTNKPPPASATFGFEAFGGTNQAPWPLAYPQQEAPHPLYPPPAYGAQSVYPSVPPYYDSNYTGKSDGKM